MFEPPWGLFLLPRQGCALPRPGAGVENSWAVPCFVTSLADRCRVRNIKALPRASLSQKFLALTEVECVASWKTAFHGRAGENSSRPGPRL